jgi:hypothetical protein
LSRALIEENYYFSDSTRRRRAPQTEAIASKQCSSLELAAQVAKLESASGLDEIWGPLRDEVPTLRLFACGLAFEFPGSSTLESDFSILELNKSDSRSSLADLSEGEFHARQWTELRDWPS